MSLLSSVFYYINILERITSFVYVLDFLKKYNEYNIQLTYNKKG
ncbi:hypothetical protein C663_3910 [Bacillus subtilis XF-1]|nr:hypothetical protein C663_3910 [Bacillus subtilis XF-1]ASK26063.1 hypothetical protein BSSX_4199 [Bacillus subtilis]